MSEWRDRVSSSVVEEPLWLDNKAWRCCGARLELVSSELGENFLDVKQGKQEDSEAWSASNQDIEFMEDEPAAWLTRDQHAPFRVCCYRLPVAQQRAVGSLLQVSQTTPSASNQY